MFYKLGQPIKQAGITGIVFPITWSRNDNPWETFHTGSLIVSGFVDANGRLQYDENELEEKVADMQELLESHDKPIEKLPTKLEIGKPKQAKRKS